MWERAASASVLCPFHPLFILSWHQPTYPSARPHGPSTMERGWAGSILSRVGLERASSVHGSDWHTRTCPVSLLFQGYYLTGSEISGSHSQFLWRSGKGLSALGSHSPTMRLSAWLDWSFPAGWRALGQPCCDSNVLPCANRHCWESGPSLKACADRGVNK